MTDSGTIGWIRPLIEGMLVGCRKWRDRRWWSFCRVGVVCPNPSAVLTRSMRSCCGAGLKGLLVSLCPPPYLSFALFFCLSLPVCPNPSAVYEVMLRCWTEWSVFLSVSACLSKPISCTNEVYKVMLLCLTERMPFCLNPSAVPIYKIMLQKGLSVSPNHQL